MSFPNSSTSSFSICSRVLPDFASARIRSSSTRAFFDGQLAIVRPGQYGDIRSLLSSCRIRSASASGTCAPSPSITGLPGTLLLGPPLLLAGAIGRRHRALAHLRVRLGVLGVGEVALRPLAP